MPEGFLLTDKRLDEVWDSTASSLNMDDWRKQVKRNIANEAFLKVMDWLEVSCIEHRVGRRAYCGLCLNELHLKANELRKKQVKK